MKIISGGQTGADQTGLEVARELGIETGGTVPKGWRTDEGASPWLATFGCVENEWTGYRVCSKLKGDEFYVFVEKVRKFAQFLGVRTADPDPEYWRKRRVA